MFTHFTKALLGTAIFAVSGCATQHANLDIMAAQERLATAYKDKNTVDRGQADLANADTALRAAQDNWQHGNTDKWQHQLMMGQTYLDLADTRGHQAKVEQETTSIKNQSVLAGKQSQLNTAQAQLADKDQQLATAQDQLREYNMKITELGSTLVLQDFSFETGKADLRSGAINRLQPMINYLRISPQTRVRIEGHTDNVGGLAFNQTLSLDRANAVKAAMSSGGIDLARIDTVGSGYTKPVGSNKTAEGRESNRRVEVTLLK